jgi:hypothetical protein
MPLMELERRVTQRRLRGQLEQVQPQHQSLQVLVALKDWLVHHFFQLYREVKYQCISTHSPKYVIFSNNLISLARFGSV